MKNELKNKNLKILKKPFLNLIEKKKEEIETLQISNLPKFLEHLQNVKIQKYLFLLKLLDFRINFEKDQNLFLILEKISRAESLIEFLLQIPYDLSTYKLRLPKDICLKHNLTLMNIWERRDGIPKEDFFDAILELSAFARRDILDARILSQGGNLDYSEFGGEKENSKFGFDGEKKENYSMENEEEDYEKGENSKFDLNLENNFEIRNKNVNEVYLYLMAAPIGYFLKKLEKADFNVFEPSLHRPSRFIVPYRMFKIFKKKEIILNFK